MSEEHGTEVAVPESFEPESTLATIGDLIETAATGIPAPIRKTLFKAIHQLCMAAVDTQVAKLEGNAAETRATTKNRIKAIDATGTQIAKRLDVRPEYVDAALENASVRIVQKRINLDKTVIGAIEDLRAQPIPDIENETSVPREEISDDWLNAFEEEAVNMSTEHMQKLFGKILAGEIRKPSSYSIRTIKLMAQLDNLPAQLFRRLCSLTCTMQFGPRITDSRVIAVTAAASSNGLQNYGLSFGELNILFEYGLIISDYNSYMTYMGALADAGTVNMPFRYMNRFFALVPKNPMTPQQRMEYKVHGVQLSRAGMELLNIVETEENTDYTKALVEFFDKNGFKLELVNMAGAAN